MIYLTLISLVGMTFVVVCFATTKSLAKLYDRKSYRPGLVRTLLLFIFASFLMGVLSPETQHRISSAMGYDGNSDSFISIASIILAIAAVAVALTKKPKKAADGKQSDV